MHCAAHPPSLRVGANAVPLCDKEVISWADPVHFRNRGGDVTPRPRPDLYDRLQSSRCLPQTGHTPQSTQQSGIRTQSVRWRGGLLAALLERCHSRGERPSRFGLGALVAGVGLFGALGAPQRQLARASYSAMDWTTSEMPAGCNGIEPAASVIRVIVSILRHSATISVHTLVSLHAPVG
jgi:hypothetical protein